MLKARMYKQIHALVLGFSPVNHVFTCTLYKHTCPRQAQDQTLMLKSPCSLMIVILLRMLDLANKISVHGRHHLRRMTLDAGSVVLI